MNYYKGCRSGSLVIKDSLNKLLRVSDLDWARWTVGKHLNGMSETDFQIFFEQAQREGILHWKSFQSEDTTLNPEALIRSNHVDIRSELPSLLDQSFVHFAVYDPGRHVVEIAEEAISKVEGLLSCTTQTHRMLLRGISVRDLVLWHEYYHVINHGKFLRVPLFQRMFSSSRCRLREEIAAIQFSKLAVTLDYNPQVLQWLLIYSMNPERAIQIRDDIIEKSVMQHE